MQIINSACSADSINCYRAAQSQGFKCWWTQGQDDVQLGVCVVWWERKHDIPSEHGQGEVISTECGHFWGLHCKNNAVKYLRKALESLESHLWKW